MSKTLLRSRIRRLVLSEAHAFINFLSQSIPLDQLATAPRL